MSPGASGDVVAPDGLDGAPPTDPASPDLPSAPGPAGAIAVLRRGLEAAPEFRVGLRATVLTAVFSAVGRLTIPLLFQQVIDRGFRDGELRVAFLAVMCSLALGVIVAVWVAQRIVAMRLWQAAENALYGLRGRTFAHIHRLSISVQNEERRGALVSRVTNDVETIAQFLEWGGINWVVSITLMVGTLAVMLIYAWHLTLFAVLVLLPLLPIMRFLQRNMVRAYDRVRTNVGDVLTEISESVMGAAVVRAYGLEERTNERIRTAVGKQYRAQVRANVFSAVVFPTGDMFGAFAVAVVVGAGVWWGPGWDLSAGTLVAMLFLISLFLEPLAELSESFDHTQNAISGFRKILGVLDLPVEVPEPEPGLAVPAGALPVVARGVSFRYGPSGPLVLDDVSIEIPAGHHVAIVGETGSGKTTFAKLLCRLADPVGGKVIVGGIDLRQVAAPSRRDSIRLVPQDGFLFDTTIAENVRFGNPEADDDDVRRAFAELGLDEWLDRMPDGLATMVGERGDQLSVGERQLVALVRAQIGSPGLLILDEATSAVDPDTEQAISRALSRLGEGRTTVAIAHRLSTAETADLVLVFDAGRIVEAGTHAELVERNGTYAGLYGSWLGNTRTA